VTIHDVIQLLAAAGAFISALAGLHNSRKLKTVHAAVLAANPSPPEQP
jgi:hypothetical protein